MYYQFGRKEPFPAEDVTLYDITGTKERNFGSDNTNISKVPGQAMLFNAVKYPYIFYYPTTGDWMSGNTYTGALWNNPTGTPTKRPVLGTWDIFQGSVHENVNASSEEMQSRTNSAGYWFFIDAAYGETHEIGNVAFYPASGYCNVGLGSMLGERDYGYYWAATPNSSAINRGLYFYSALVNPQNALNRGNGFPVRCVQK